MTNAQRGSVSRQTVLGRAASLTISLITVESRFLNFLKQTSPLQTHFIIAAFYENSLVFALLKPVCIISSLPAALLFLPSVVTHWLLPHPCVYICVWWVAHLPLSADDGRVNLEALDEIPLFCFVHLRGF